MRERRLGVEAELLHAGLEDEGGEDRSGEEDAGGPPESGRVAVHGCVRGDGRGVWSRDEVRGGCARSEGVQERGADRAADLLARVDHGRGDTRVARSGAGGNRGGGW